MQPFEVRGVDDALVRLSAARVLGDALSTIEDDNVLISNEDLHRATDEAMGDAVADSIDVDEAVGRNLALLSSLSNGNRPHR